LHREKEQEILLSEGEIITIDAWTSKSTWRSMEKNLREQVWNDL